MDACLKGIVINDKRMLILLIQFFSFASLQGAVISRVESLDAFLKRLEQKHNVSFVYDGSEIDRLVEIETIETGSLETSLNLLSTIGITYKVVGQCLAPGDLRFTRWFADDELVVRRAAGMESRAARKRSGGGNHAFLATDGFLVQRLRHQVG